jgi:hypothetical protein
MIACCASVNRARQYYFMRVRCLQVATAAVCYLRLSGYPAQLVVGIRRVPFEAHAWAELDGLVVNDFPAVQHTYAVIGRW